VSPSVIFGSFCVWVSVDVGSVATGFEQREAQCVLASQKGATSEAAAIADDPETLPVTSDVEIVGRADTYREEIGHGDLPRLFHDLNKKVLIP
jgi:hypothetical protein